MQRMPFMMESNEHWLTRLEETAMFCRIHGTTSTFSAFGPYQSVLFVPPFTSLLFLFSTTDFHCVPDTDISCLLVECPRTTGE